MKTQVYECLLANNHVGKVNGAKTEQLLQELGRTCNSATRRTLLHEIQTARRDNNELICSDTKNGYYLPSNVAEVVHFRNAQFSRAKNAFRTAKTASQYIKAVQVDERQSSLF